MDTLSLQSNTGEGIIATLEILDSGADTPFISSDATDSKKFSSALLPRSPTPENISEY